MRPTSQPLQRAAMAPSIVYPQTPGRPPLIIQQYSIVNRNGIATVPQPSAPNMIQMRPIPNGQSNGAMSVVPRSINQQVIARAPNQGASRLNAFFKQLLDLSQKNTSMNTHSDLLALIQELVDRTMNPEEFCSQLEAKLRCGTTSTRTEISALVEDNINSLRCDLFHGTSQIPGIKPPSEEAIDGLLQRHTTRVVTSIAHTTTPQRPAPTRLTTPVPPAAPNATVIPAPGTQQRLIAAHTSSISPSRATFYTDTPANVSSGLGSSATGQKFLVSGVPGQTRGATTIISQQRLIAPGAAGGSQMVVASNPPGQIFRPAYVTSTTPSMTVRQSSGVLTSIPVTAASTKAAPVASITPSQPNFRQPLPATILAPKPEIIETSTANANDQPFFPKFGVLTRMKKSLYPAGKVTTITEESAAVMAHGLHTFIRHLLVRLGLVVQHRTERLADDKRLELVDAPKDQLNFLQKLDERDQARQSDMEKELIYKAARSRSKVEDPDQARVKEIAKRLQNEEYEREKHNQANLTALNAIGPATKKRRLDEIDYSSGSPVPGTASELLAVKRSSSNLLVASSPSSFTPFGSPRSRLSIGPNGLRASGASTNARIGNIGSGNGGAEGSTSAASALVRVKRANLKDLQFIMSKHHMLNKGPAYYRTYWR